MERMEIRRIIRDNPLLAILRNVPKELVVPYVENLVNGGVNFFEVALNSKDALEEIHMLRKHFGNRIFIGAGTAITVSKAESALEAGAEFLLSPSTDETVLDYCEKNNIPILPGALTPSDVSKCIAYGCMDIKLFPAGNMPMKYVKSLQGPFSGTEYVAIGGVKKENVGEFLKNGYIGVGMGSNLLPVELVTQGASMKRLIMWRRL